MTPLDLIDEPVHSDEEACGLLQEKLENSNGDVQRSSLLAELAWFTVSFDPSEASQLLQRSQRALASDDRSTFLAYSWQLTRAAIRVTNDDFEGAAEGLATVIAHPSAHLLARKKWLTGRVLQAADQHADALSSLQSALGDLHSSRSGEMHFFARLWHSQGVSQQSLGQLQDAQASYCKALSTLQERGTGRWVGRLWASIGSVLSEQGDFVDSVAALKRAIPLLEACDDMHGQSAATHNLALAYQRLGLPAEATQLCQRALEIPLRKPDQRLRSASLALLGRLHHAQGMHEKAMLALQGAIRTREGSPVLQATSLAELGELFLSLDNVSDAKRCLERAWSLIEEHGDLRTKSIVLIGLARTQERRGHADDALKLVEQAVEAAQESGKRETEFKVANSALALYRKAGHWEAALGLSERLRTLDLSRRREVERVRLGYGELRRELTTAREREQYLVERLTRQDNASILSRTAGRAAHDLNNLFTVIIGQTYNLRRARTEDSTRDLDILERAVKGASELVRELLGAERTRPETIKVVDLGVALRQIVPLIQRAVSKTVTVEAKLTTTPLRVRMNTNRTCNAVLNLAINASDAMPEGGTLTLGLDAVVESLDGEEVPLARVSVTDTGLGVTESNLHRIFDPQFSTKGTSGLGLSNALETARMYGGDLRVSSQARPGASFELLLPIFREASTNHAEGGQEKPLGAHRILVFEEDREFRSFVVDTLRSHGQSVTELTSETGLRQALAAGMYEVVVGHFPEPERLRSLQQEFRHLRFVLTNPDQHDRSQTASWIHLPRPFRPRQLVAEVCADGIIDTR